MQNCNALNINFMSTQANETCKFCNSRTLGSEMGKPHILGTSVDSPWVKFPKDFCLEPLQNMSCTAPAGVSAVVYDTNPLVSYKHIIILTLHHICYLLILHFREAFHQARDFPKIQKL